VALRVKMRRVVMKCKEEIKMNELVRRNSIVITENGMVQDESGSVSCSK
jgi:hypothetical protein